MQERHNPSSTQAPMRTQPTRMRRFGLLAAGVCLVVLVVGSIAMVFFTSRQNTTGPASVGTSPPTATTRPTPVVYHPGKSLGNLVYSATISDTAVFGLAWSPDSTRLGVAAESSAQSWVATTGKDVVNYGPINAGFGRAVAWSPDGKLVALIGVGQGVQVYDARTGVLVKTYADNGHAVTGHSNGGYLSASATLSGCDGAVAAWSPDGHLMASAFYGVYCPHGQRVQVWNISTGQLVQTYTGNVSYIESLSWSPAGTYVASSSVDGNTQVWNALVWSAE